jgi:hypothetical protein
LFASLQSSVDQVRVLAIAAIVLAIVVPGATLLLARRTGR